MFTMGVLATLAVLTVLGYVVLHATGLGDPHNEEIQARSGISLLLALIFAVLMGFMHGIGGW